MPPEVASFFVTFRTSFWAVVFSLCCFWGFVLCTLAENDTFFTCLFSGAVYFLIRHLALEVFTASTNMWALQSVLSPQWLFRVTPLTILFGNSWKAARPSEARFGYRAHPVYTFGECETSLNSSDCNSGNRSRLDLLLIWVCPGHPPKKSHEPVQKWQVEWETNFGSGAFSF